jgi:hypothetical protein
MSSESLSASPASPVQGAEPLKVAIAVPLEAELVEAIRAVDPSVTVLFEPDLLPPERFPADHSGDPAFRRSRDAEERYWKLMNSADVLYGFPNESAAGFARVVAENPRLRWVHAMAAGAGGAVKASGVSTADLERVMVTTSAGVHALPLAEFALMGILNGLKRTAELAVDQRAKRWPELRTPTRLAAGSHVVIAGLGEIGLETARLARALGMNPEEAFARLVSVDDSRVATGRDFDATTGRVTGDVVHLDEAGVAGDVHLVGAGSHADPDARPCCRVFQGREASFQRAH